MGASLHVVVSASGRTWLGHNAAGRYRVEPREGGGFELIPAPVELPFRIVDSSGHGWHQRAAGDGEDPAEQLYMVYPGIPGVPSTLPYGLIVAKRGPVQEVVPAPEKDVEELKYLLANQRQAAVTTLLSALGWLRAKCVAADGHPYRLTAGRPGSWESADLLEIAKAAPVTPDETLDHPEAEVRRILSKWVFGDAPTDGVVEVAENLAALFGQVVDGRGGWDEVVDEELYNSDLGDMAVRLLAYTARSTVV